jgi:hypothetical protein
VTARRHIAEVTAAATGRELRDDPMLPVSGGPAGNAHLTAWTGLVLLVLFIGELVTLVDVHHLISWHIAIGMILVPAALAKTASTGWRILRYYTGAEPYRRGGPPPLFLRLLGPLVVLTTLALLASGIVVVVLGPESSREALLSIGGFGVSTLTLHQGCTVVWAVVTGLHVLARTIPAVRLASDGLRGPRPAGAGVRTVALVVTLALGAVAAIVVLRLVGDWTNGDLGRGGDRTGQPDAAASTGPQTASWALPRSRTVGVPVHGSKPHG